MCQNLRKIGKISGIMKTLTNKFMIDVNMDAINFMSRCEGEWVSHRRYLQGIPKNPVNNTYKTEFTIEKTSDNSWLNTWRSETPEGLVGSEGEMELIFVDDECRRSRGYMSNEPDTSKVQVIDEDCVVWHTSYSGMTFREEIRLLENDTVRLRQTVAKRDSDGAVFLVGHYFEQRS